MKSVLSMVLLVGLALFASETTVQAVTAPAQHEEAGKVDRHEKAGISERASTLPSKPTLPVPSGFSTAAAVLPGGQLPPIGDAPIGRLEQPEAPSVPLPGSALFLFTALAGLVLIHRRHVRAAGEAFR